VVSVSKHISITKAGRLKFQKKPLDVTLANVARSDREHVVHYMIRDHFSGAFYGEICSSLSLMPVEAFLLRAWAEKDNYLFCGVPDYISIPKTVGTAFQTVYKFVDEFGIEILEVTSGFQGGIRDIRTWEDYIRQHSTIREDLEMFQIWQKKACKLSAYLSGDCSEPTSKIRK
jgi:hypothetical protein